MAKPYLHLIPALFIRSLRGRLSFSRHYIHHRSRLCPTASKHSPIPDDKHTIACRTCLAGMWPHSPWFWILTEWMPGVLKVTRECTDLDEEGVFEEPPATREEVHRETGGWLTVSGEHACCVYDLPAYLLSSTMGRNAWRWSIVIFCISAICIAMWMQFHQMA